MIYNKPLSKEVQRLVYTITKNCGWLYEGFIIFNARTSFKVYFDEEECLKTLDALMINKESVLKYLEHKYIPTPKGDNTLIFKDQSCIQKVRVEPNKTLFIHIKNSECHKIITDTIHVMRLLDEYNFDYVPEIKYFIEQIKLAPNDIMLYNMCTKEFGYPVPYSAKLFEKKILWTMKKLEKVAMIKMKNQCKKFLRWRLKQDQITREDYRLILKNDNYRPYHIKKLVKQIRDNTKERGIRPLF